MTNVINAMQVCGRCGQPKVAVNESQKCLRCDVEPGTSSLVVTCDDPGDDKMKQVLAASGVVLPKVVPTNVDKGLGVPKEVQAVPVAQPLPVKQTVTNGKPVQTSQLFAIREAIYRLPMPKSIKQYKRFQKIQALIDEAVAEETQ